MSNNKDRITERESLNINLVQPRGTTNTDYNYTYACDTMIAPVVGYTCALGTLD